MSKGHSKPAAAIADPAVPVVEVPFMVKATMGGTYPDPGMTRARWRNVGDVFEVKCQRDFSHRWMQRLSADEIATSPLENRQIPQTTAKARKPAPFPPMA
jgi:hypothetical protein